MNCYLKSAFSRGSKGGKLYLIFSSGFIMQGPALGQIGPVGETHRRVLSLEQAGELWKLVHYQLFIKGLNGVVLRSALRWLRVVEGRISWLQKSRKDEIQLCKK